MVSTTCSGAPSELPSGNQFDVHRLEGPEISCLAMDLVPHDIRTRTCLLPLCVGAEEGPVGGRVVGELGFEFGDVAPLRGDLPCLGQLVFEDWGAGR